MTSLRFVFLLATLASFVVAKESVRRGLQENGNPNWKWDDLRFVTFGGSRTCGVGLPEDIREDATFSGLLNHADNKSVCGSSMPEYPALCLHSLIGEDSIYDVIVLEFLRADKDGAMFDLTRHLRTRFPHAIIIYLDYWFPNEFSYIPEDNKSFRQYYEEHRDPSNDDFQTEVLDGTNEEDWAHQFYDRGVLQEAADEFNAFVLAFPEVESHPIETVQQFGTLFGNDMEHFNRRGHAWIRDKIIELLSSLNYDNSRSITNPFPSMDYCEIFYTNGQCTLRTNMTIKPFQVEGAGKKYALEVRTGQDTIDIYNTFGQDTAYLYLSFMATGPEAHYTPKTLVQVFDKDGHPTANYVIDSQVQLHDVDEHVEVVVNYKIGPVSPGESTVRFTFLDTEEKQQPESSGMLRIVGLILSQNQFSEQVISDF